MSSPLNRRPGETGATQRELPRPRGSHKRPVARVLQGRRSRSRSAQLAIRKTPLTATLFCQAVLRDFRHGADTRSGRRRGRAYFARTGAWSSSAPHLAISASVTRQARAEASALASRSAWTRAVCSARHRATSAGSSAGESCGSAYAAGHLGIRDRDALGQSHKAPTGNAKSR